MEKNRAADRRVSGSGGYGLGKLAEVQLHHSISVDGCAIHSAVDLWNTSVCVRSTVLDGACASI